MHEQQLQRLKSRALKAKVSEGRIICPVCKSLLGKAYYGGLAYGIELWCKNCKKPVTVELRSRN